MKFEVLVATMNQMDMSIANKMNISTNALIINQAQYEMKKEDDRVRMYSYKEKGLSKSRNRALENAKGEIVIIADDDLKYVENAIEIIEKAYEQNGDADIIVFQVKKQNGNLYKKYKSRSKKLNYIDCMKVSSVEITFRLNSIKKSEIKFNELLGSGAQFYMGEESEFLSKCLKKKMNIIYVPQVIAVLEDNQSTWFEGYNERYFESKGAAYYAISKQWYVLNCLQFIIRKRKIYIDKIKMLTAFLGMMKGSSNYKELIKN